MFFSIRKLLASIVCKFLLSFHFKYSSNLKVAYALNIFGANSFLAAVYEFD